jgi:hypothetical protein
MKAQMAACGLCLLCACASGKSTSRGDTAKQSGAQASQLGTGDPRCNGTLPGREVSEYDTSGDDKPDVRKVYARLGDLATSRLVMICREADVNRDGRKDVTRIYDDEGRSLREDSDRNFDGKKDQITTYQSGEIVVQEFDDNFDGKFETKVYYDKGLPVRAERDLSGRSTESQWRPDRYEYFDGGKLVRMGTDLDGDTRVDHWDRDAAWKRAQDVAKAPAAGEGAAAAQAAAQAD